MSTTKSDEIDLWLVIALFASIAIFAGVMVASERSNALERNSAALLRAQNQDRQIYQLGYQSGRRAAEGK